MRCPQCIKEDKKSIVTQGWSISTTVHYPTRYDEEGRLMPTGVNSNTKTQYLCSKGHCWEE